jgi:hypothetical protein
MGDAENIIISKLKNKYKKRGRGFEPFEAKKIPQKVIKR